MHIVKSAYRFVPSSHKRVDIPLTRLQSIATPVFRHFCVSVCEIRAWNSKTLFANHDFRLRDAIRHNNPDSRVIFDTNYAVDFKTNVKRLKAALSLESIFILYFLSHILYIYIIYAYNIIRFYAYLNIKLSDM